MSKASSSQSSLTSSSYSWCSWSPYPSPTMPQSSSSKSAIISAPSSVDSLSLLPTFESTQVPSVKRRKSRPLPKVPRQTATESNNPPSRQKKSRPLPIPPIMAAPWGVYIAPTRRPLPNPNVRAPQRPSRESLLPPPCYVESPAPQDSAPSIEMGPLPSPTLSVPRYFVGSSEPAPVPGVGNSGPVSITLDIQTRLEEAENCQTRRLSELAFVGVIATQDEEEAPPLQTQECIMVIEQSPPDSPFVFVDSPSSPRDPLPPQLKRYSQKWIREERGKRWVVTNYQDILQALRKL